MNRVVLIGRLTKDIDLRYTNSQDSKAVGSFTLAVNKDFKNAQGQTEADFINCVVWGKRAETMAEYIKKGQRVAVEGRWQTRTYDNDAGNRVYVNECNIDKFDFLETRSENGQNGPYSKGNSSEGNYSNSQAKELTGENKRPYDYESGDSYPNDWQNSINDDDLPF
jgi:single-strand DNA-binding protein